MKDLSQLSRNSWNFLRGTCALYSSQLLARHTPSPTTSFQSSSDDHNTMMKKLASFAASLTEEKHTGQHPVASSSKSAVKAPPEALEALFSSKSNPTRPPGSASARRAKPSKHKASLVDVLHHHPSKTPRPSHQEPRRTLDHVGSPHKKHPTVPTDTTIASKPEGKPTSLLEQTSKPDKGKGVDPLERGWPRMFKDGLLNSQLTPPRHKTKPDKGKGVDPLERGWPRMFQDGLLNAQHADVASKAEAPRHSPRSDGAGSLSAPVAQPSVRNQTAVEEPSVARNDVATAVSEDLQAPLTAQDEGDMDVDEWEGSSKAPRHSPRSCDGAGSLSAPVAQYSVVNQTAVAEPSVAGNDVTTAVSGELHAPPTEQGEEGGPMDVDWEGSSHSSLSSADEDDDNPMEVDDEDVPMTDMTPESQPNHTVSCYGPCNGITLFQAYC
ncbi:hypothetical protein JB92DRAFT_30162 [Gautieria morchelliformis]|nr:hypothetical protein JB92DRAFT_30162 [Gautieria morchelliformis]